MKEWVKYSELINDYHYKKTPDMLTFIIGGTSRSTASFVLYPINLIRTRQMKQRFSVSEAENFKRKRGIHAEGVEDKEVYYVSFRDSAKNLD